MKKHHIVPVTIFALLILAMPTAWALPAGSIDVVSLRGDVSVRSGSGPWASLQGKTQIASGAWIRTAGDSEGLVKLADGVALRLAPDTRVMVSSDGQGSRVQLESGRLFGSVPEGSNLLVSTGPGSVAMGPGEMVVTSSPSETRVRVLKGLARLEGAKVSFAGMPALEGATTLQVVEGMEGVAQGDLVAQGGSDDREDDRDRGGGIIDGEGGAGGSAGAAGGAGTTGTAGAGFPIFAVLGGLGLLGALIALIDSQSSPTSP